MPNEKVAKLKNLFCDNGHPSHLVNCVIENMLTKHKSRIASEDEQHQVFICVPLIGGMSLEFGKSIRDTGRISYPLTSMCVVFSTAHAFSSRAKDVLPSKLKHRLVYEANAVVGRLTRQNDPTLSRETKTTQP